MGFVKGSIATNSALYLDGGTISHFGILVSTMHNAWLQNVGGRLKSDFRYSAGIVYNNFPWPTLPKPAAQAPIETAAQNILDDRTKLQSGDHPATLADLYDPLTMPPELLKAHQKLDAAVDKAYEPNGRKKSYKSNAERVAFLFELYQKYTSLLPADKPKQKRRR